MKFSSALCCLSAVAVLTTTSCTMFDPKPRMRIADAKAVLPPDFLYTRYEPLNKWLDTAMRVQMYDTPLVEAFNHPALRGLNYRWVKRPVQNPEITIDSVGMTRRQLLWALGQDYQLHMTPVFGPDGQAAVIEIRSLQQVVKASSSER